MDQCNEREFADLIKALAEIWETPMSPVKSELYFKALEDLTIEQVKRAVYQIIKSRTFASMPKPGEIREAIEGTKQDKATEAWLLLDYAVRYIGHWSSVQFDDSVIHSVVEAMGGWEYLCTAENSKWKWKRKEFENLYPIMAKRTSHSEFLLGETARMNMVSGYENCIPKPVIVAAGNIEKIMMLED